MQFQDDDVAEEYYHDAAWLNDYAWIYIVGGILIMFAVLGCCYCLCTMGGESATPPSTNGYSVITSPAPSAALSPYDQKMYEAMSTDVKKKSMKKQMSQAYPTLSPAQYQPAQYAPYGGAGSFRAVPMPEKVVDVEETKPKRQRNKSALTR